MLNGYRSHLRNQLRIISDGKTALKNISCPACKSSEIQIREDVFCCRLCPNREHIDYFRLLGLPRNYSIDIHEAEERFRTLQRSAHPDKAILGSKGEIPEGDSSLLNTAIRVLKSPTERALHLLYLADGCGIPESVLTNDAALLVEMMELNEAIDDCGKNKSFLERQYELNQERLNACDVQLRDLFASRQFTRARKVCERMHYLERMKDTIIQKLNSL